MVLDASPITLLNALTHVLSEQYRIMEHNVPGVLADDDPEPLHDLRVASRRSRAALNQMKPAIEPGLRKQLLDGYRTIAKTTNRMRDLDVYMDVFAGYVDLVPEFMHRDLKRYLRRLRQRRKRESRKTCAYLVSADFLDLMRFLDRSIHGEAGLSPGSRADVSAVPYACRKILKSYDKVLSIGNNINEDTPDAVFHKLRIRCKKLRYLMEFFRNSFPKDRVYSLIRQLKSLQTLLGDFNDLSVQIGALNGDLSSGRRMDTDMAAMLGGLIVALHGRKSALRKRFHDIFDGFSHSRTRKTFQKVYG